MSILRVYEVRYMTILNRKSTILIQMRVQPYFGGAFCTPYFGREGGNDPLWISSQKQNLGKISSINQLLGITNYEKVPFGVFPSELKGCCPSSFLTFSRIRWYPLTLPLYDPFFAKTCETKIKLKSDPLRAFGSKWVWSFFKISTRGDFCPPLDWNRV